MKIRDIITEGGIRKKAPTVGNSNAMIARSAKQAVSAFVDADRGAIEDFDPKETRKRVRELYGVELVDDFIDVLELPNGEDGTDKQMSMFSKDLREAREVTKALYESGYLTEGVIRDLLSNVFDKDGNVKPAKAIKDFWRSSDNVMRGLILGLVGTLALMGGVIKYAYDQGQYEKALHQAFIEYAETQGYTNMAFQEDFENYLAVRELAMERKTITVTEPVTTFVNGKPHTTIQTRAKSVPKYPEKVAELAVIKEKMKSTYSIDVDK